MDNLTNKTWRPLRPGGSKIMKKIKTGKLIGVSLGPGDPGLITRQAWELLSQDHFWTYPVRARKSDSYALSIVLRAGLQLPEKSSALVFPMTHDLEKLAKHWLIAAETVLPILQSGQDVLFLVEGDASTYSTFGHLAKTVVGLDDSIHVETIAGVSSFNAAAARLDTPLAEVDETMAILPAGYGIPTIDKLLDDFDTLVLLKVKPILDDILDLLEQRDLLAHTQFIEKAGTEEERIVKDVASLRGETVNYLSLMLVKNVRRVRGEIKRGCRKKPDEMAEATN